MSFENIYGGARESKTSPEGKKEMSDLMLALINFAGRAVVQGPRVKGGRPIAALHHSCALALTAVCLASCATQDVTPSQQSVTPFSATGAAAVAQSDDSGTVAEPSPDKNIDGRGVIFSGTDVGVQMPLRASRFSFMAMRFP